ncbi:MAG: FKBP-type peptidyl-prolyl cis-trans isomerase, partial [Nitrososphaerales archaeon]
MTLEKGSLVLVNLTGKIKDTGEIIETTLEEDAKKYDVHDPTKIYEPRLISVGDSWVMKGLDEALGNASVGESVNIDVLPQKAFGERDPNKVRMISHRKLGDKADEVKIGDAIEIDNKIGIVRVIGSGRVQIDYNHRLAGKTIFYSLQVLKRLEKDEDKIIALIRRRIPIPEEKLKILLNEGNLDVELPSESYMQEGLQIIKRAIVNDIFRYASV